MGHLFVFWLKDTSFIIRKCFYNYRLPTCVLFFSSLQAFTQPETIVHLNRLAIPSHLNQREFEEISKSGLKFGNQKIIAGDFSDSTAQFTIALCDFNSNGRINDIGSDLFIIALYKSESVCVYMGVSQTFIPNRPVILLAQEKKYSADLSRLKENIVLIKKIKKNSAPYDVKLFDHLPDISFPLLSGRSASFSSFKNKKKLIYVSFWNTEHNDKTIKSWTEKLPEFMNYMEELKKIYNQYKDSLFIISLDYNFPPPHYGGEDADKARKLVKEKKYDWVQGIATSDIADEFLVVNIPYGVLFNSDGSILKIIPHSDFFLKEFLDERFKKKKK